jgi:chromatin remodeling complex protein RSC6
MAKQSKSKTSESTASTSVPETVQETVQTVAPIEKAEKVKKVKAVKPTIVAASVAVAVAVETASTVAVVDVPVQTVAPVVAEDSVELDNSLFEKSAEFMVKLQQLGTLINSLKSEYKTLEKQWSRDLKVATKQCAKKKKRLGARAPSGFVKPTRISDELAHFLEQPLGSEMARTEVTRDINKYIRTNNLQDKTNGRKIIPDVKLSALLKIQKGEELTYFNLQRYMSCHFAKSKGLTA